MALPALADLQQQVNNDRSDGEALLTAKLEGAVAFARDRTGRQFELLDPDDEPVELTFRPRGRRFVRVPDAREVTTVELAAAVAFARDRTGRQFDLLDAEDEPVELTRRPRGSRFVRVPDAREVTTVELDGVEAAADEYTTHESNGFITVLELCARPAEVVVTGKFGMAPAFPDDLREAILEEAANRYYDRETGNSDSAASDEYGPASFSRPPGWARAVFKSYRVPSDDFALA